jgi:hypothetical protein
LKTLIFGLKTESDENLLFGQYFYSHSESILNFNIADQPASIVIVFKNSHTELLGLSLDFDWLLKALLKDHSIKI